MAGEGGCAGGWVCSLSPDQCLTGACLSAAERVTSLGKDWHRPCLKCEKCGKTLTSGGHAEVGQGLGGSRGGVGGGQPLMAPLSAA